MPPGSRDRVLLLSCSQRKRSQPGVLPALERYDGPAFRVLRRYLRGLASDPPDVYILSAEFGLIPADRSIPNYDRRMTRRRAEELQPAVAEVLGRIFTDSNHAPLEPHRLLVCLGKDYLHALHGYDGPAAAILTERIVAGGLGHKLTALRDWLYSELSPSPVGSRAGAGGR